MLLEVDRITVDYGAVRALREVSFSVGHGEIVSLVGANGAGKTTTLRTVSGILKPVGGRVVFDGKEIGGLKAHVIARKGIAHVPEGRGVFANMSVRENLEMGAFVRRDRKGIADDFERVYSLFPRMKERLDQVAGTLSGGEQQMLALGRAILARPKLVLLDEPSMGLAPRLVREIFDLFTEINRGGTAILLVEQNAFMALSVAHRAYVLETGTVMLSGEASALRDNPKVRAAYLGDVG
jgi:branched-chain amino acid transport system ATP-binding protein